MKKLMQSFLFLFVLIIASCGKEPLLPVENVEDDKLLNSFTKQGVKTASEESDLIISSSKNNLLLNSGQLIEIKVGGDSITPPPQLKDDSTKVVFTN